MTQVIQQPETLVSDESIFSQLWNAISMGQGGTVHLRTIVDPLYTSGDAAVLVEQFYDDCDTAELEDMDSGWYDPHRTAQVMNGLAYANVSIPPRAESQ